MIDWVEAAKSAYRFIGNPLRVKSPEYARRLEICRTCPDLNGSNRCKHCGCFMAQKAKFEAFQCPIGKWASEDKNG